MRPILSAALLLALHGPLAAGQNSCATEQEPRVPRVMRSARLGVQAPLWVDAAVAFDAEGNLRHDLFSAASRSLIEDNRRANANGRCSSFLDRPVDSYSVPQTFDDVVRNALTIVRGEVVEIRPGFDRGIPATLAVVRISERLKAAGKAMAAPDEVYVVIPDARIATPQGAVCSSTPARIPRPVPGNEVVVFADLDPMDERAALLDVDPRTGLVVVTADAIHLPHLAEQASIHTLPQLLGALRGHPGLKDRAGKTQ